MGAPNQPAKEAASKAMVTKADRLALYDQYGSVAYGVILQIIPQPELAQNILIELFASPQLRSVQQQSSSAVTMIVRLARAKALEHKPAASYQNSASLEVSHVPNHNPSKLVFDLTFREGYKIELIAEKLHMSYSAVTTAIRDYFAYLRAS